MKNTLFCLFILLPVSVFAQQQQYLDLTLLSADTRMPLEAMSISNRTLKSLWISNEKGRVRISGAPGDKIVFNHISFEGGEYDFETLIRMDSLFFRERNIRLREVAVRHNPAAYNQLLNRCLRETRRSNTAYEQYFQYDMETLYQDTLMEKAAGVFLAMLTPETGFERIDLQTANYGFNPEFPFLNTAFSNYFTGFKIFLPRTRGRWRSVLNVQEVNTKSHKIQRLPCTDCGEHELQLALSTPQSRQARAKVRLDTLQWRFRRVQLSMVDSNGVFLKPIQRSHRIEQMNVEADYRFDNDGTISTFDLTVKMDYRMPQTFYPNIQFLVHARQRHTPEKTRLILVGKDEFSNDLEKIILTPAANPYLQRWQHQADEQETRRQFRSMNVQTLSRDNAMLISVLRDLQLSDAGVWTETFGNPHLQLSPGGILPDKTREMQGGTRFDFLWAFFIEELSGRINVYNTPTFVHHNRLYFSCESNNKALFYYNFLLDYCEMERRLLLEKIARCRSIEEAHQQIKSTYEETYVRLHKLHYQSGNGRYLKPLEATHEQITKVLGKNSFKYYLSLYPESQIKDSGYTFADVLALSGNYKDAIEAYKAQLQQEKSDTARYTALANRAICYYKLGLLEEACSDYTLLRAAGFPTDDLDQILTCTAPSGRKN